MAGTKIGGKKASQTNIEKHGKDYYSLIGAKGGRACGLKGFALNPELAKKAGSKGGKISKRGEGGVRKEKVYKKVWGE